MPTQTRTIETEDITYLDSELEARIWNRDLYADIGTRDPASILAPKSDILLAKQVPYSIGMALKYGLAKPEDFSKETVEIATLVYKDCQSRARGKESWRGHWHRDGVDIFNKEEVKKRHPKLFRELKSLFDQDYVLGRYFQYINGFEQTEKGWKIKPSHEEKHSKGILVPLPPGGGSFIVPVNGRMFHEITGTSLRTEENEEEAVKQLMEGLGLNEKQVRNELSRNYRGIEGTRAVRSDSGGYDGPLCIVLDDVPRFWDSVIGSFPVSRIAERSEAPEFDHLEILENEKESLLELSETLQK